MTPTLSPTRPTMPTTALNVVFDEGERYWTVSRRTMLAYLLLPWAGAVLVALSLFNRPLFRFFTAEDNLLEWVSFACMAGSSVCAAAVAWNHWRAGRRAPALLWAVLALGAFLIAGEEIAWAQRVFDLETPEALDEINHQGEITAHNINGVQDAVNVVFLIVGFLGSVVTGAVRWREHQRRAPSAERRHWFSDYILPPTFLASLFAVVFGYKLVRFVILSEPRRAVVRYGEYVEFCLAFALISFAWFMLRRLRAEVSDEPAPRAAPMSAP